jgi:hypothetical protein
MARPSKIAGFLFILAGFVGARLLMAFPLWLDSPTGHSNRYDQKSPFYKAPIVATPTPAATATHSPTMTVTPSISPTFTASPPFSATPSPTITMTFTASPTPESLVADFEGLNNSVDLWSGPILTSATGTAAAISPSPWGPAGIVAGNGPSSCCAIPVGGVQCAYISGTLTAYSGSGVYPSASLALELVSGGSSPGFAGTDPTINSTISPNMGLQFDYKADAAGTVATGCNVQYQVMLVSTASGAGNTDYYQFTFTPTDTAWHTLVVYFPVAPNGPIAVNSFSQAGFGTPFAFSNLIGAIIIKPVTPATGTVNFGIRVDNVTFAVPAAPQLALDASGTVLTDFEQYTGNNTALGPTSFGWTYGFQQYAEGPFNVGPSNCCNISSNYGNGTSVPSLTLNVTPGTDGYAGGTVSWWCPISGTSPGSDLHLPSTPNYPATTQTCATLQGVIGAIGNGGPGNDGYMQLQVNLVWGWWNPTPSVIDLSTYSPHRRLVFDYKIGTDSQPGLVYSVLIQTADVSDGVPWQYRFSPAPDGLWHNQIVYFPGEPYGPQFSRNFGAGAPNPVCQPWDPTKAEQMQFMVWPQATAVPFDISIDNILFD